MTRGYVCTIGHSAIELFVRGSKTTAASGALMCGRWRMCAHVHVWAHYGKEKRREGGR